MTLDQFAASVLVIHRNAGDARTAGGRVALAPPPEERHGDPDNGDHDQRDEQRRLIEPGDRRNAKRHDDAIGRRPP